MGDVLYYQSFSLLKILYKTPIWGLVIVDIQMKYSMVPSHNILKIECMSRYDIQLKQWRCLSVIYQKKVQIHQLSTCYNSFSDSYQRDGLWASTGASHRGRMAMPLSWDTLEPQSRFQQRGQLLESCRVCQVRLTRLVQPEQVVHLHFRF